MRPAWIALARWRQRLFTATAWDDGASFALASISGMPRVLPFQRIRDLRGAGLSHLMAVSGIHIAILATTLARLLQRLVLRLTLGLVSAMARPWGIDPVVFVTHLLAFALVLGFVFATGGAPSAYRALACWSVVSGTQLLGLSMHRLATLGWIGWTMLVLHPQWSLSPGYYCSMVATAILVFPRAGLPSVWATSWRLCWGLAPLSLLFFERAAFLSVVANLLAVPVFTHWVLPFGLCGLFLAALATAVGMEPALVSSVELCLTWAGFGGQLILDLAAWLGPVGSGGRDLWGMGCAWILVVAPKDKRHRVWRWLAPPWLLWLLASAPLWSLFGV